MAHLSSYKEKWILEQVRLNPGRTTISIAWASNFHRPPATWAAWMRQLRAQGKVVSKKDGSKNRWYLPEKEKRTEMKYRYFAQPLWQLTPAEFETEVGEVEEFTTTVYRDRNGQPDDENPVEVTVVAPVGYNLQEADWKRLEELINET